MPSGCLDHAADQHEGAYAVEEIRNSLMGNGFHLPSAMFFFVLLSQCVQPSASVFAWTMRDKEEQHLKTKLQGTVWEPGKLANFPGVLNGTQILQQMLPMLVVDTEEVPDFTAVGQALDKLPLWQLQAYWADLV